MHRLAITPEQLGGERVIVTGDDHHYLTRVLRLGAGARLVVFDGAGGEADAVVVRIDAVGVELALSGRRRREARGPRVTLIQGLCKGDKVDLVVQKATELGVAAVVIAGCARSDVRLDAERGASRRARWQRIALEAARQSRRADVPEVGGPLLLDEAIGAAPADALKLVLWEEAREDARQGLRRVLPKEAPPSVVVAVGPEGGFAGEEIARARRAGFQTVGLGPRVLRTETAGLAVLAVLAYLYGDLGA